MCFDTQFRNELVNYDYAVNKYSPEGNCETDSRISNVNLEIDVAWNDAIQVTLLSPVIISSVALEEDIGPELLLAEEKEEYGDLVLSKGFGLPLKDISIQMGDFFTKPYVNLIS